MAEAEARSYFVLTTRGDRGPLDRSEMRELLQSGEIAGNDQVRTAFGRSLGTVAEVLGRRSGVISNRQTAPPIPSERHQARRSPAIPIIIAIAAIAVVALLTIAAGSGSPAPPPPLPQPEARPVAQPRPPPTPVVPSAVEAPPGLAPGLVAEFFALAGVPQNFPDFDRMTPDMTRIEQSINANGGDTPWPGTSFRQNFAMRATGVLNVNEAGEYGLSLISDDGSRLFLDGVMVINNDGLHGSQERSVTLPLSAGQHPIVLLFTQGEAEFNCQLAWWSQSQGRRVIDGRNLFHKLAK